MFEMASGWVLPSKTKKNERFTSERRQLLVLKNVSGAGIKSNPGILPPQTSFGALIQNVKLEYSNDGLREKTLVFINLLTAH